MQDYDVVWTGATVDSLGTKGGLTGEYPSRSTWHRTVEVLARKLGRPPDSEDENNQIALAAGLAPGDLQ